MFKKAKENKKGFTLAELLIVVAIIAVLVAISIPIFTSQLEKSREAVDISNARAAYAEVMTSALSGEAVNGTTQNASTKAWTKEVTLTQKTAGWTTDMTDVSIGGVTPSGSPSVGGNVTITYTPSATGDGTVTVAFS